MHSCSHVSFNKCLRAPSFVSKSIIIFIMFESGDKTCLKMENLVSISSLGGKKTIKQLKKFRSSRPEMLCTQKTRALESLFNRVTGLMRFHVNFVRFLKTPIL